MGLNVGVNAEPTAGLKVNAELIVRLNNVEGKEGLNNTVVPANYSHFDNTAHYSRNTTCFNCQPTVLYHTAAKKALIIFMK